MHYSIAVAALFAGVAMAHGYDYSGDAEVPVVEDGGYHVVSTAYSTADVIITACDSTVKDCPLRSHTSVPVVETPHPSVPASHPAAPSTTSSATQEVSSSVEIPAESHPSVPVIHSVKTVPVYPTGPSIPSPPFPIGTAPAGSGASCPVCPAPVTIYSTITRIPTEAPSGVPVSSLPIVPIESIPPIPSGISVPSITYVPIPSGGAPAGTGGASSGL